MNYIKKIRALVFNNKRHELINRAIDEAQFANPGTFSQINETYAGQIKHIENNSYLTIREKAKAKNHIVSLKDIENLLRIKGFLNWTSGNEFIDKAIQSSQMTLPLPQYIVEWIPYQDLKRITYKTKGGFALIYSAIWVKGRFESFDKSKLKLKRFGSTPVVLKRLIGSNNMDPKFLKE
ncbi:6644_t:CDS:2, partial [Acaulospora colombiana]